MRKKKKLIVGVVTALVVVLFSACTPVPIPPVVEALPYRFSLDFSSQLPADVYPVRAPFDSHKSYRVNARLKEQLEQTLSARSADNLPEVVVTVKVISLTFDYEEIGADQGTDSRLLLASREFDMAAFISSMDQSGGGDVPSETVKTAIIQFEIAAASENINTGPRIMQKTFVETVSWDDMYAAWPYDYHTFDKVISGVILSAVEAVDTFLVEYSAGR